MTERLRDAIAKARAEREGLKSATAPSPAPEPLRSGVPAVVEPPPSDDPWLRLSALELDRKRLRSARIVSYDKSHPAHMHFDVLRTRLAQLFREKGWRRLAVTSPTAGCGKTMVAANLALSLARQRQLKTLLFDMDLRRPGLAQALGVETDRSIADLLNGEVPASDVLLRNGANLALGLNGQTVGESAELIQSDAAMAVLAEVIEAYQIDVALFDLPPLIGSDDSVAFLPSVDCVLLVVAANQSKAAEIETCERLIGENSNFLGVVLNKSD
ncbi:MAG: CpsD/CapB family tyrosine-protein kinase [Rhodospirillales bacterium]